MKRLLLASIAPKAPLGSARYQKDWALSGRYDFNSFLYLKGGTTLRRWHRDRG